MSNIFEKFDDIEHLPLKVFNRVVNMFNLVEDSGAQAGENYLEQFTEGERRQMYLMAAYIKQKSVEAVRKEVTNGLEVVDNE